ncbi:hypothetical protein ABT263_27385 [Kitasatospora sp. NPDC001603]|uniref:hypothetical protein n=1 Tax=Kitasatospora sp. NPDC001603 TaxID=3154388 RepID=UPI00332DBB6D
MVDATPLLTAETIAEFGPVRTTGVDLVTGERDHFGLGFEAQGSRYPFLGPDAFGHSGAVGAQSFADPRSGVAYGYTRRRFGTEGGGAPETHALAAAVLRAAAFGALRAGARPACAAGRAPATVTGPSS